MKREFWISDHFPTRVFSPSQNPSLNLQKERYTTQLGPEGVYVNTVSPGVVLTGFHVKRIENKARENHVDYDVAVKRDAAKVPLGRHASPEEVAQTVKFLLSKDSDFIYGVNLVIDGGATLSY